MVIPNVYTALSPLRRRQQARANPGCHPDVEGEGFKEARAVNDGVRPRVGSAAADKKQGSLRSLSFSRVVLSSSTHHVPLLSADLAGNNGTLPANNTERQTRGVVAESPWITRR